MRSFTRASFLGCGHGLASAVLPNARHPGGQMRRTVRNAATLASAAMLVLFAVSCDDDDIVGLDDPDFIATLSAANEPPPANAGTGSGTATFVDEGDRIDWTLSVTGLTGISDSHIHLGASGVVGGIIINLFTPRGGATGPVNGLLGTG